MGMYTADFGVFPIIDQHEIKAPPHYGIITMIGGM